MISQEAFMDIVALKRSGLSIRKIARKLGIHRKTVRKHLAAASFPEHHHKEGKSSLLDPYRQVIRDFLDEVGLST
jgi:transposase